MLRAESSRIHAVERDFSAGAAHESLSHLCGDSGARTNAPVKVIASRYAVRRIEKREVRELPFERRDFAERIARDK